MAWCPRWQRRPPVSQFRLRYRATAGAGRGHIDRKPKLKGPRQQPGQGSPSSASRGAAGGGEGSVRSRADARGKLCWARFQGSPAQPCGEFTTTAGGLLFRGGPGLGDQGWDAEEQVLMKLSVAMAKVSWGFAPGVSGSGLLPSHSICSSAEGPAAGGPGPGSTVSIRRGSSGEAGRERQRRAGVTGCSWVSGVVTMGGGAEGSGEGGASGRGTLGLLGVSRSLILPPLRSSRNENGFTRVRLSPQFGGNSGEGGRKRSDRLLESRGSGLGSVAEGPPLGTVPGVCVRGALVRGAGSNSCSRIHSRCGVISLKGVRVPGSILQQ